VEPALKTAPKAASGGAARAWLGIERRSYRKRKSSWPTTWAATLNTKMSELQPAPRERILVIEDDRALRKILERLLSSEGYEVDVVPDGAAGLEMIAQRPPSAVIVDLPHPVSSSCDLCKKIAEAIPSSHLLILSASSDIADKALFLEMGADSYVTIPFSPKGADCTSARAGQSGARHFCIRLVLDLPERKPTKSLRKSHTFDFLNTYPGRTDMYAFQPAIERDLYLALQRAGILVQNVTYRTRDARILPTPASRPAEAAMPNNRWLSCWPGHRNG